MSDYSIWVLEYARAPSCPAGVMMYLQPGLRDLPYSLTVLQSDAHTVVVDTGYDDVGEARRLAEVDGITKWCHPVDVLGRVGIFPEQVDTVLITHAHYDHLGTLDRFPNATAYIQRAELDRWNHALSLSSRFDWLKDGVVLDDLQATLELIREGRLRMVEGRMQDVVPGVTLEPSFDTHTYGHQHVVVDSDTTGRWVLPGDAVYVYENLEGLNGDGTYVPIGFATGSQEKNLIVIDQMVQAVGGETNRIIPGHEANLWHRHPSRSFDDGLWMAEICLRPDAPSLL